MWRLHPPLGAAVQWLKAADSGLLEGGGDFKDAESLDKLMLRGRGTQPVLRSGEERTSELEHELVRHAHTVLPAGLADMLVSRLNILNTQDVWLPLVLFFA